MLNWFKRLPLIRKLQWIVFLTVVGAMLSIPLMFLFESKFNKERRLRNQAINAEKDRMMLEELEKERKIDKVLTAFERRFGYRPEKPYSDQDKLRIAAIYGEIYGNK